jgi:uncharacterized membrane protein
MINKFLKSSRGSVAIMYAAIAPVLLLSASLAVDVGTFYLKKRQLQGATDLAAIAAAQNSSVALQAAQQNLALNGFSASAVQSVVIGQYTPNASTSPSQWFTAQSSGNAVQVVSQIQAPYYFANILSMFSHGSSTTCTGSCTVTSASGSGGGATITATSTAAIKPRASFAIGSGLASLNGGVLNAVLGGLLGANVSLGLMDYQSLASTNVDLFAFSNALATRLSLTGVTYSNLANQSVAAPVVLGALADAVNATPGAAVSTVNDLLTLANLAPSTNIQIGQLLSFGDYGSLAVNSPDPITATVDALDLVSGIAQIANGQHQIQVGLNVNVAPIASASLALTIGERPVGSGFVSIGETGATVHTAQTRLLLTLQVAETGSSSLLNLPIYIELASGTATLTAINCPVADPTQESVTLSVTPAVISAWIGNVSSSGSPMTNFSSEPTASPVTIVTIPLVGAVTASANAAITNLSPTSVTFNYNQIVNDTMQTTSTTDYISSLLSTLFGNLTLTVNVLGLQVTAPQAVTSLIGTSLAAATSPIDQVLSQTLDALGISLGNAYTWVSGVNCGSAKLVL